MPLTPNGLRIVSAVGGGSLTGFVVRRCDADAQ